ncbi:hypothetical protein AALJ34_16860 [Paraclostridium bifermentans]|uniref:hypothetical protein n=1 Tax=Paraclostridium bifermentans TaxID=1490 RepID=UPI001C123ED0|nr:hypothetical protein [Paraclostridium bifermentans]MBU5288301.1 hypothetical protein [Paraclostridium bifermentans]
MIISSIIKDKLTFNGDKAKVNFLIGYNYFNITVEDECILADNLDKDSLLE